MRNVRAAVDRVCSRGGDNAGKRGSISAHPLPCRARPAKVAGEGRCYLPPASLAFSEEPPKARGRAASRQCRACARRSPAESPGRAPSISAASLPMTQHPPQRSRFLPAPGNRRRTTHAAGTLSGMLPHNAEGSEALVRTAPQAGGRFPGQGIRLPRFQARFAPALGEVRGAGKAGLRLCHAVGSSRRLSPVATCFSNTTMGNTPLSFLLPALAQCRPRCFCLAHFPHGKSYPG